MPEVFLYLLHGQSAVQQQASRRMPQLMEADMRQPVLLQDLGKSVRDVPRLKRPAVIPCADVVAGRIGVTHQQAVLGLSALTPIR